MSMKNSPLKELVEIQSGFAFKSECFNSEGIGMPLIRIRDVLPGKTDTYYDGSYDEQFIVTDEQILIGMDGEFNCARWKGGRSLLNQRVCRIQPKNGKLDSGYLFRFLPAALRQIESRTSFVTVKHLSSKDIFAIEIPLPPVDKQRRIAAILDQADDLRCKRQEAIDQLDRLRQAVFIAEFVNGSAYPKLPLSQVCELITDGTHYTPTYAEVGIIFLSAKNVTSKRIDWDDVKYVPEGLHQELQKQVAPQLNDILLAKNGTTGVAALVDRDVVFDIYVSLALLRPGPKLIPSYLLAAINSQATKRQFTGALKGIGVPNLHLVDIRSATIPVPPTEIQREFSNRLDEIDILRESHRAHLTKLDALFASLQHRAFRGEL